MLVLQFSLSLMLFQTIPAVLGTTYTVFCPSTYDIHVPTVPEPIKIPVDERCRVGTCSSSGEYTAPAHITVQCPCECVL